MAVLEPKIELRKISPIVDHYGNTNVNSENTHTKFRKIPNRVQITPMSERRSDLNTNYSRRKISTVLERKRTTISPFKSLTNFHKNGQTNLLSDRFSVKNIMGDNDLSEKPSYKAEL